MVLDSGATHTTAIPVHDGYVLQQGDQSSEVLHHKMTVYLQILLGLHINQRGHSLPKRVHVNVTIPNPPLMLELIFYVLWCHLLVASQPCQSVLLQASATIMNYCWTPVIFSEPSVLLLLMIHIPLCKWCLITFFFNLALQ